MPKELTDEEQAARMTERQFDAIKERHKSDTGDVAALIALAEDLSRKLAELRSRTLRSVHSTDDDILTALGLVRDTPAPVLTTCPGCGATSAVLA